MKSSVVLGQPRCMTFLNYFSLEAQLFHCGFLLLFFFFSNPSLLLLLLKCFNQKLILMLECSGLGSLCTYDMIRISIHFHWPYSWPILWMILVSTKQVPFQKTEPEGPVLLQSATAFNNNISFWTIAYSFDVLLCYQSKHSFFSLMLCCCRT